MRAGRRQATAVGALLGLAAVLSACGGGPAAASRPSGAPVRLTYLGARTADWKGRPPDYTGVQYLDGRVERYLFHARPQPTGGLQHTILAGQFPPDARVAWASASPSGRCYEIEVASPDYEAATGTPGVRPPNVGFVELYSRAATSLHPSAVDTAVVTAAGYRDAGEAGDCPDVS